MLSFPVLLILYISTKNIKRDLALTLVFTFSALLATHINSSHITIHNSKSRSYIKVQGLVENVHYHDEVLHWDPSQGARVSLKLNKIYKNSKWHDCTGRIQIFDEENKLKYGDNVTAEGALIRFKKREKAEIFSYETYLKFQGLSHWMRLDSISNKTPASGYRWFFKQCFSMRDWLISRAGRGLKLEDDRKLLASMFFGYKGLLESEEKEIYKRSGTVHLFAVSGLHIGIAAACILLFLRGLRLSLATQTISLICLLAIYVLMTGAPSSAIRAFVMISVWSIARGFMLPSNGMNNICFSAFLLILINPLNLISAGFYYTFIITAFLVLSYNKSLEIFQDLNEKKLWMGRTEWGSSWTFNLFLLFTCSLSASLATFGLNIIINQQVIPFALFTNMVASTLAWISFIIAILSVSGLEFLYTIQAFVLKAIRFTSESGEFSWFSKSALSVIILYYCSLFLLPVCKNRKLLNISGSLCIVLIIYLGWPQHENSVTVSVPSSSNIANVKIKNEGRTYLLNCSSNRIAKDLFHQDIDCLILPDIRADHIKSLEILLRNSHVKEIIIFRQPTAYFKRILKEYNCAHLVKTYKSHPLVTDVSTGKDHYNIQLSDYAPGINHIQLSLKRKALNTSTLNFLSSHSSKQFTFKYSNTGYEEIFSF